MTSYSRNATTGGLLKLAGATLLLLVGSMLLSPQSFAQFDLDGALMGGEKKSSGTEAAFSSKDVFPVSRTVDRDRYVLGAGDMLALILTRPENLEGALPVTADGMLLVPRIGAVKVAGLTLAEAEKMLFSTMKKSYKGTIAGSISLVQPRTILVRVGGQVRSPGMLTVSAGTPVSVAMLLANARKEEQAVTGMPSFQHSSPEDPGYRARLGRRYFGEDEKLHRSLRNIDIRHSDGSFSRADLVMYQATGDSRFDPYLREGDAVFIPVRELGAATIGIFGAVRNPGVFEFVRGDKLSDLVAIGMGVDDQRQTTSAELVREDGTRVALSIPSLLQGGSPEPLKAGDRLYVYAEKIRSRSGAVAVDGEVALPGVYPVVPGVTRLSEVIEMAGGFTREAWPSLSELYRKRIGVDGLPRDVERDRTRDFHMSNLSVEDTLHWSVGVRADEGRVSVDFNRLFMLSDSSADVTVEDGDILLVPRNTGTVYVYGQVHNAGFVPWEKDRDLDWYIEQAGGYGDMATEDRTDVIKGNTRAWVDPDEAMIEPGDFIYVPHEPLIPLASTTDILAVVAAIVGGLAGITSLIITLSN